jgi:hypothetical protein
MPTGKRDGGDVPFPVRGGRCLDFWQVPDVLELAAIRLQVATSDAVTARIARELQREQRREAKQREQARTRRGRRG